MTAAPCADAERHVSIKGRATVLRVVRLASAKENAGVTCASREGSGPLAELCLIGRQGRTLSPYRHHRLQPGYGKGALVGLARG